MESRWDWQTTDKRNVDYCLRYSLQGESSDILAPPAAIYKCDRKNFLAHDVIYIKSGRLKQLI